MKIAIFSGAIPSTTFVEHLIEGVAKNHNVLLFGVVNTSKNYNTNTIKIYSTPKSLGSNFFISFWRTVVLSVTYPKRLLVILQEVKKYKGFYYKWMSFSRFLPVVLHLPDLFHVQWAKDLERWLFLKERLGVKLVLSLRGAHINYSPIANKMLAESYKVNFPKVDAFHAVSHAIVLEAQKYNASHSKIKVIHSPVIESTFKHFKPFKKPQNTLIKICSIGRFHWIKGMKYMFDALYELKQQDVSFEYTCISSNTISEEALFQIHQLDLGKHVRIKNDMKQAELFSYMKTCDVLVLPSLKEGIANVVLEAMAVGLPVIVTNCGGMSEIVKHKETGWLVPVRDSKAIADAVIDISQTSESELQKITQNAYDFVKANFNAKESIRQFLEMYQSVVSSY